MFKNYCETMTKSPKCSKKNMILKCTYCSKQFNFQSEKKRHEESHFVKYECILCKKTFNFDSALKRHEKQHVRTDPVNCIICGHYFQDKILLKRHIKYAHQGESHSCSKCGAIFGSDKALRVHAKSHQPKSQRRFCCSHIGCNKTFNFSHHLKHHELTHNNVKQHYCNVCGKGFIQLHHLKTHLKVHEPDKWMSCNVLNCKKKFTNEYALRRHLKTHVKHNPEIDVLSSSSTISAANDKVLCNYCGEMITKKHLMKHTSKCGPSVEKYVSSTSDTVKKTSEATNIDKNEKKPFQNTESLVSSKYGIEVNNNCKSAIGVCIVTGDSQINENCLCIKMSVKQDHIQEAEDIIPKGRLKDDSFQKTMNSCEDCDCSNIKFNNNKNIEIDDTPNKENSNFDSTENKSSSRFFFRNEAKEIKMSVHNAHIKKSELPESHSKNTEKHDIQVAQKFTQNDFDNVPFNSCKAILGNCIVSGDQTIGEGCLCAKMSQNVQHSAPEFEDMTPLSEICWSN